MARLDFAKVAIWTTLGLSAIGGATHFWLEDRIRRAEEDSRTCLRLLSQISTSLQDITILEQERQRNRYLEDKRNNRLREYFALTATNEAKMSTGPNSEVPRDTTPGGVDEYVDTTYELTWKGDRNKKARFQRNQIAAYCWHLEKTGLLRITHLRLETEPKERDDTWTPTIRVTERRPVSKPSSDEEGAES